MSEKQTSERWKAISPGDWGVSNDRGDDFDWCAIGPDNGYYNVVLVVGARNDPALEDRADNITASVNFTEGFPTQALEGCSLEEVVKMLRHLLETGDWRAFPDTTADALDLLHKLKPEVVMAETAEERKVELPFKPDGEREGPSTSVRHSCQGCRYLETRYFSVQDDSGFDKWCWVDGTRKSLGKPYTWDTPDWCPLLPRPTNGIDRAIEVVEGRLERARSILVMIR